MPDRTDATLVKSLWTEQLLDDLGTRLKREGNDEEIRDLVKSLVRKNLPLRYLVMKTRKLHGERAAKRLMYLAGDGPKLPPAPGKTALKRSFATRLKIWYRQNF